MNKSIVTNIIALILTVLGYTLNIHELFMIGLFALSGSRAFMCHKDRFNFFRLS